MNSRTWPRVARPLENPVMADVKRTPESPINPSPAPVIEHSASERPATRGDRIAFQVWMIMFLGVIAFTLIQYILMTWKLF